VLPSGPFPSPAEPATVRIRITSGQRPSVTRCPCRLRRTGCDWVPIRFRQGRSRFGVPDSPPAGPLEARDPQPPPASRLRRGLRSMGNSRAASYQQRAVISMRHTCLHVESATNLILRLIICLYTCSAINFLCRVATRACTRPCRLVCIPVINWRSVRSPVSTRIIFTILAFLRMRCL
jgi:hypothetical protein